MNVGVVVFPGSNCDQDCFHVVRKVLKEPVRYVWHKETDLSGLDAVILPGGFSYGDYLRTGSIARFSPIMKAIEKHAQAGKLVLGICNGFQILLEAGLLPGAMMRNRSLRFACKYVGLRTENNQTPFSNTLSQGQLLQIPIAHGEGNYTIDSKGLEELEQNNQIVFRYCDDRGQATEAANPNGSVENIAGICNRRGNVLGMMPHPERCSEEALGSEDGLSIFRSMQNAFGATIA